MRAPSRTVLVPLFLLLTHAGLAHAQAEMQAFDPNGSAVETPLVEERLQIAVDRQYATATLRQVYQSESAAVLEGRFLIQLGEGAAVQGFAYWNGEEKIVGEVFEKETATAIYEEVTGGGRDPGLLEEVGEGAFAFRIFPIAPGERKPVEVTYGRWLPRRGPSVELRSRLSRSDAEVVVEISGARDLERFRSPTHRIDVEEIDADHVRVRTRAPIGSPSEFSLAYDVVSAPWTIDAHVHRDAGHDAYVVLSLAVPELADTGRVTQKDVTLVLDRSGSMSGAPIEQAKRAALDLVDRLRTGDRLNVVAFDDAVEPLFTSPRELSEEVRADARAFLERVHSGGGTNLPGALERALALQHDDSRPHVVLFLTDGQSDSQATLEVARADRRDARVYTIGVGNGVDRPLLSRLASQKRGKFTFIESAEAIEPRMSALYAQLAAPVLVGVGLEVDGVPLTGMYPATLPDLYRGDELRVAARALRSGGARVKITGRLDDRPVAFERTVVIPDAERRPWVGRLWAQARVTELLEAIALEGETEERKNEVIELAIAYNFVTPYTSFLAIPESELTESIRSQLDSAREARRQLLAQRPDAAALSRSTMPPGDPIVSVRAPANARSVTASFPFGLVLDLFYDTHTERWVGRFLVPRDVSDGTYEVHVAIEHTNGEIEHVRTEYTIDSASPDFAATTEATPEGLVVRVTCDVPSSRVSAALVGMRTARVELTDTGDGLHFVGLVRAADLPAGPGTRTLRVVVADRARNEGERLILLGAE